MLKIVAFNAQLDEPDDIMSTPVYHIISKLTVIIIIVCNKSADQSLKNKKLDL